MYLIILIEPIWRSIKLTKPAIVIVGHLTSQAVQFSKVLCRSRSSRATLMLLKPHWSTTVNISSQVRDSLTPTSSVQSCSCAVSQWLLNPGPHGPSKKVSLWSTRSLNRQLMKTFFRMNCICRFSMWFNNNSKFLLVTYSSRIV